MSSKSKLSPSSSPSEPSRSMSQSPPSSSSSSVPTVKVSSPLKSPSSPLSTPTHHIRDLPIVDESSHHKSVSAHHPSRTPSSPPHPRPRGHSFSTARPESPASSIAPSLSRVYSGPPSTSTSTIDASVLSNLSRGRLRTTSFGHRSETGSKERSLSPLRDFAFTWRTSARAGGTETPPNGIPTTWWNSREPVARPWHEKKQKTIPPEQSEGWARTRTVITIVLLLDLIAQL